MTASAGKNLHPVFDRVLSRAEKERRLRQRSCAVWLYGLSGSGKSTLANALERRLHAEGFATQLLDGDNVRSGLNRDLGFADADRAENIRRAAEVARLFVQAGIITISAFITPRRAHRELARGLIGAEDFIGVCALCPAETCAQRDVKGLYAQAAAGALRQLPGRDAAFEPPGPEDLILDTATEDAAQSLEKLYARVRPRLRPAALGGDA